MNINQAGETISKAINKSPKKIKDSQIIKDAIIASKSLTLRFL